MDGIDLAYAKLSGTFPDLQVKLLGTHYKPYSSTLKRRLISVNKAFPEEISQLNVCVAEEFSLCVKEFLTLSAVDPSHVDGIGSHGQTIFHSSGEQNSNKSSLQIGAPSIIAELTDLLTVGNFRVRDIAGGGQGAPLVGIADYILFRDPNGPIALNNLGSISNLTVVTPALGEMLCFDTGPANMPIDFFARKIRSGIDSGGALAKKGSCIPELLELMMNNPFFERRPPKSAGYAEFGPERLAEISRSFSASSIEDLLRTSVEFSALTIEKAYRDIVLPNFPRLSKIIFSGGGIYNATLMGRIRELLPELRIDCMDEELSDAKEALAFAILANETLSGRPGSFPALTGVQRPTVLGEIAL